MQIIHYIVDKRKKNKESNEKSGEESANKSHFEKEPSFGYDLFSN